MAQGELIESTAEGLSYIGGISLPGVPRTGTRDSRVVRSRKTGRDVAVSTWRKPYRDWKASAVLLLVAWRRRMGLTEPLQAAATVADVTFVFARPKTRPVYTFAAERIPYPLPWSNDRRPYLGSADLDNLDKGPPDALVAARILTDDRWVWRRTSSKLYAAPGCLPCVEIRLWRYHVGGRDSC